MAPSDDFDLVSRADETLGQIGRVTLHAADSMRIAALGEDADPHRLIVAGDS
jgi:hypothetical protein